MVEPVRRIPGRRPNRPDPDSFVTREWLVTNGLGGYASGTVRRSHHATLSRAVDRRLAGAARSRGDAQAT